MTIDEKPHSRTFIIMPRRRMNAFLWWVRRSYVGPEKTLFIILRVKRCLRHNKEIKPFVSLGTEIKRYNLYNPGVPVKLVTGQW